ncbi:MAG: hypothetical protein R2722_09705 [Tessaracoccus sp.]
MDEFVEDDSVRDPWSVTAQWVGIDVFGQQRFELVPQGFHDERWQSRHEYLAGEERDFDTSFLYRDSCLFYVTDTHLSAESLSGGA